MEDWESSSERTKAMAEFNLIDEAWIPCIDAEGEHIECGIRDALLWAHELREIRDDSPLITVALHRLLLAILYRVHDGPRDFRSWTVLYTKGAFESDAMRAYFSKWHDRFDLLGKERPFYQMAQLETRELSPITRLATECASGNNPTLFDHSVDQLGVEWEPSKAARWLVACQAFALGFGRSGTARINGTDEAIPYSADAIALRGMNVWLQGANLFDTLMINLIPSVDPSLPAWELDDAHLYRDRLENGKRRTVSSFGLVDRLTWQSRLVRLTWSEGKSSWIYFTQGRSADKSPDDPMKVYRLLREEGVAPLPLSSGRAVWRDAHSLLMIPQPKSGERRPECFNLVARARVITLIPPEEQFVAHVVGLATAPRKSGKFLLWRHDQLPVSASLIANTAMIERLGGLLGTANQLAEELRSRMWQIARFYRVPYGRQPNESERNDIDAMLRKLDPRPAYWTRLEEHFVTLLEDIPADWDALREDWKADHQQMATNAWRVCVKAEARRALRESIISLGTTARAIQAIGRVRTDFSEEHLESFSQDTGMIQPNSLQEELRIGDVNVQVEILRQLCRKWKIHSLQLFGSARTGQLGPNSDIDLLAEFEADEQWSLMDLVRAQEEFSELFGRPVDLVDRKSLECSANPIRRDSILNSAEVLYAA
jgi:CRISPR system Cascade subunit CasA